MVYPFIIMAEGGCFRGEAKNIFLHENYQAGRRYNHIILEKVLCQIDLYRIFQKANAEKITLLFFNGTIIKEAIGFIKKITSYYNGLRTLNCVIALDDCKTYYGDPNILLCL